MQRNQLIMAVLLGGLISIQGFVCAHTTVPLRFQLIGFTSAELPVDSGVLGFAATCQAEFPGSRMCTSEEILETTTLPTSLAGSA